MALFVLHVSTPPHRLVACIHTFKHNHTQFWGTILCVFVFNVAFWVEFLLFFVHSARGQTGFELTIHLLLLLAIAGCAISYMWMARETAAAAGDGACHCKDSGRSEGLRFLASLAPIVFITLQVCTSSEWLLVWGACVVYCVCGSA
jgi:hypothetical protein